MSAAPRDLRTGVLETTWGKIRIRVHAGGVESCGLPSTRGRKLPPFRVKGERLPAGAPAVLRRALAYARAVVEGRRPGRCPPIDPAVFDRAAPFRREAWRVLQGIPRGTVRTYGEVARRAGRPGGARAAGGACGANPVPLFIPCHRVVAASGPGGFSSGPAWKQRLLEAEGWS